MTQTTQTTLTTKEAIELVGGLASPSKMPCYSWSTSASACKTGAKLRKVAGSICSKCYALKGNYNLLVVRNAHARRLESLSNSLWVEAMTIAISGSELSGYFRFHDSGDIQSVHHLHMICQVARNLPAITFWLPTREYTFVSTYLAKHGAFPLNLTVRLSAYMLDSQGPATLAKKLGVTISGASKEGFNCPSSKQGNKCLACRKCWDKNTFEVNYKTH